ncbi:hypothetical protein N8736_05140, partial [Gammaproteobacteria bacterium]|nr:hypothetical protein [Gammaproteobacteria bacterium]
MAKLKNKLSYLLTLLFAGQFSTSAIADDEPKAAEDEDKASESAKGELSAGAIAAAVAAAAAL